MAEVENIPVEELTAMKSRIAAYLGSGTEDKPLYEYASRYVRQTLLDSYPDGVYDTTLATQDAAYSPRLVWGALEGYFAYYAHRKGITTGYMSVSKDTPDGGSVSTVSPIVKPRPYGMFSLRAYTGIPQRLWEFWAGCTAQIPTAQRTIVSPTPTPQQALYNRYIAFQRMVEVAEDVVKAHIYDRAMTGLYQHKLAAHVLGFDKPYEVQERENTSLAQITGMRVQ